MGNQGYDMIFIMIRMRIFNVIVYNVCALMRETIVYRHIRYNFPIHLHMLVRLLLNSFLLRIRTLD